ncbi:hypothetical protein [Brachybacterium endophyticum]|nr:hypothetical protein [Brachybacterium endophyticum]
MSERTMAPAAAGGAEGAAFARRLREMMLARGVGFSELAGMLAAAGAPTSSTTLSYWVSGRSRPRRRSSLGVVRAIEQCLALEDGELVDLVDIDAETWRYRSAAEVAGMLPYGDEIDAVRRDWGLRWDDGMRRECVHTVLALDATTGQERLHHEVVLSANRSGADRLFLVVGISAGSLETDLRIEIGGRLARVAPLSDELSAIEIVLPRRLVAGEGAVVRWSCPVPGLLRRGRFLTVYLRPVDIAIAEIHLPSADEPWTVRRTLSTVGRERPRGEPPRVLRAQGPVLKAVMTEVAAGTCLHEWERRPVAAEV